MNEWNGNLVDRHGPEFRHRRRQGKLTLCGGRAGSRWALRGNGRARGRGRLRSPSAKTSRRADPVRCTRAGGSPRSAGRVRGSGACTWICATLVPTLLSVRLACRPLGRLCPPADREGGRVRDRGRSPGGQGRLGPRLLHKVARASGARSPQRWRS